MSNPQIENSQASPGTPTRSAKEREIQSLLVAEIASELEISAEEIDIKAPFDRYGLDSLAAVRLVAILEERLEVDLSPTLPYEYPTVHSLAEYLSGISADE